MTERPLFPHPDEIEDQEFVVTKTVKNEDGNLITVEETIKAEDAPVLEDQESEKK